MYDQLVEDSTHIPFMVVDTFHSPSPDNIEFGDIIKHCKFIFTSFYVNSVLSSVEDERMKFGKKKNQIIYWH